MTDLEMTKLCAEAISHPDYGFSASGYVDNGKVYFGIHGEVGGCLYDPLHDDAQAMALVKKLGIDLMKRSDGTWHALVHDELLSPFGAVHADLNRAIVECVEKLAKLAAASS